MEAMENNFTTVNDLNAACRICLQIKGDMVDIFGSGMDSQIMEVTKLKLRSDDRLPKTICRNCSLQMNNLYKFIEQAKSSDTYLRTLLISQESVKEQLGNKLVEKNCLKKSEIRKRHCKYSKVNKKLNNNFESEKMYLIIVPEGNDKEQKDLKISIKDLSSSNVNLEIFHYCKSLIKSQISDHTYPKEQKDYSDIRPLKNDLKNFIPNEYFSESEIEENKVYFVNFKVLKCEDCKTDFEEITDLNDHISTHKDSPSVSINNYECPVCNYNENIKVEFMAHLHSHTLKGLSFVTINADGEEISLQDSINVKSNLKSFEDCKVFNLNFSSVKCSICFQNIQSEELIPDHIKLCLSGEFPELEFFIKYTCPVCYKPFFNDKENFIGHLSSHQNENIYFINVTDTGQVVKSENYEKFVPYEKAFEAIKIYNEGKIFKIVEINSCENCDYVSESFDSLCKHYRDSHSQEISKDVSLICQLCLEEWKTGDIDEERAKFYEHLRTHQNKGVTFIRVNKNGSFFTFSDSYSEIFNQSIVLYSLINNPLTANQIWTPELITNQKNNIDFHTYTCDLCQKQFMKKREVIKHLKLHQTGNFNYKNSNYICEKCGKKCTNKITYRKHFSKHLRTQGQIKKYPICSVCNKTFSNRSTLNGHMRQHFKEGVGNELGNFFQGIICEKCGKEFSNNASLTKHKKLHLGDKENSIYKCEICDRDFFRQSAFERHKSAHLNPKYFECNVCKLPLSTVTSLQKHSEMHQNGSNTFDCKTCRVSFLTKDSLTAHQTRKGHNLDRKPLECNVCHEKFFIGKRFMEHIKTHPKYKMEECNLCGKRLSTIQSLMLHMDRHFESNCILCPHCGKQFFEEKNYRRHLMTHDGIRPFLCDVDNCKKSFYTLFELNRHKKYHNNTRDFRCSYCSKSFHEANHLTVHIRIHTGERPYICPHCNKGFVTRTRCKQHIKLVHQGVGYELIRSSISKKVTVFTNKETVV